MEVEIYQHDAYHMTKLTAMPIYGKIKTIQKSSSLEPVNLFPWNLVCM